MTTTFLMGAESHRSLKPQEIPQYCVRAFPWVKNHPEAIVDQLTMQVACISHRGGQNLRQTLGNSDFFGYSVVFDALARSMFEVREYEIDAVRLQGTILLRHDKKSKKNQIDRNKIKEKKKSAISARRKDADGKVNHFQCASSKLISDGRSYSLAVLVEHTLDKEGEPIVNSKLDHARAFKEHDGLTPSKQTLGVLGQVLRMQLTGMHRREEMKAEKTLAQIKEIIDGRLEQLMWRYLAQQLPLIQELLPNDGDCVHINLSQRNARNRGSVTVARKGVINPASLRDDFRSTFRI
ncbi:hypothetical protein PRIPAC_70613 [Pristionchus pacificus]|uniref:Uncharacterized protein n=1 Tax=Pristionchus pacificus TaxID=54126 RepID=A0A2A6BFI7_PRIPA|nr:hypothetical protein PRIPAC_70613 [Pristionchus pacificus]|eukprot:PDM64626.1 hypothetical protein PRIPAC_52882 [Pristionchus pacificus]